MPFRSNRTSIHDNSWPFFRLFDSHNVHLTQATIGNKLARGIQAGCLNRFQTAISGEPLTVNHLLLAQVPNRAGLTIAGDNVIAIIGNGHNAKACSSLLMRPNQPPPIDKPCGSAARIPKL